MIPDFDVPQTVTETAFYSPLKVATSSVSDNLLDLLDHLDLDIVFLGTPQ